MARWLRTWFDARGGDGFVRGPSWLAGLGVVAFALVMACGLVFAQYLGGIWVLAGLLAVLAGMAVSAWLYLQRKVLELATFFLTLSLPIIIDFQIWEPKPYPLRSGFPVGLTIYTRDVFLLLVGGIWLGEIVLRRNRPTPKLGWPTLWIGVFLAGALLFPIHSADVKRSFIVWTQYLRLFLVFFYLAKRLDEKSLLRWIVIGIAANVWLQSLIAAIEYAIGGPLGLSFLGERGTKEFDIPTGAILRTGALMGHPNDLSLYMAMVGQIMLALALRPQRLLPAIGWWSTFVVANATLILTFSRAGWICAATGYLITFYFVQTWYGRPLLISVVLPIIGSILIALALFFGIQDVRDRILMPDQGSTESRWQQFQTALNIFWHWPIAGTGLGSYMGGSMQFLAGEGQGSLMYRVHNGSLLLLAEAGIIAFIGYHAWWVCIARRGWGVWRIRDEWLAMVGIGTIVGLAAWFAKSLYNIHIPPNNPSLILQVGLLYGVVNCAARDGVLPDDLRRPRVA